MQDYLFAKLPIALIKCGLFRELKPSSVVVYNVLLSYADFNTGTCFPSILTICDFAGLSEPTVVNAIKELEEWGLVEVIRRPGTHNVYQLKYWWGSEPTTPKNLRGGLKQYRSNLEGSFIKNCLLNSSTKSLRRGSKHSFYWKY